MPTFSVALPLNHPDSQLSEADRNAAAQEVAAALREVSGGPFGAGATRMRLRFLAGAIFPVTAMWAGELASVGEGSLVVIELPVSLTSHLRTRVPAGYPIPRKLITGPLYLDEEINAWLRNGGGSFTVTAGQIIGTRVNDTLELGFIDANDLAIDPEWCLHLFDALRVWDLPDPGSNLLQALASLPPIAHVVPLAATASGAGVTLLASGSNTKLIRPPPSLAGGLTSFLASQTVTIGLQGVEAGVRWGLFVEDLAEVSRRSADSTFLSPYDDAAEIGFNPQRDLPPAPGQTGARPTPLRYRVSVDFEDGRQPPPAVEIEQDLIDVLRQEYEDRGLVVPGRERFGPVPGGQETFEAEGLYQNDAYFGSRLGIDPLGLPQLVEALGHAFDRHLHPANLAPDDVRRYLSAQLIVLDGYRSPEKNRQLGGANDHPAQHGFYVKLRPLADTRPNVAFGALVAASLEILEALRTLNAPRTFSQLELRLIDGARDWIWAWLVEPAGVQSAPGPDFPATEPPVEANAFARGYELELFFVPTDLPIAIRIPAPQPRATPALAGKVSIIMYGSEVAGANKLIPVDDAAYTLRNWLKQTYPEDSNPEIVVVENPVQVLERLGVFSGDQRDIRFVFFLSHSYIAGLQLLRRPGTVSLATARWPSEYVHSNAVMAQMRDIYGSNILFGQDDKERFATHQFRISNLTKLPRDMQRRLRANLKRVEGIFLIGCKSDADAQSALTITEAFATTAGVPVWGAGANSHFYKRDASGNWSRHTEARGEGDPNAVVVVLLPENPGFQWEGKDVSDTNLVEVYRLSLIEEMPAGSEE